MIDQEKVVRALECCVLTDPDDYRKCDKCPYHHNGILTAAPCMNGLMAEALALLEGQEPRMMTLDEIYACDEGDCLYYQCKGVYDSNVLYISSAAGFYVDLRTAIHRFTCDPSLYGSEWRCWTGRPTDKQRKAVKWEKQDGKVC